MPGPRRALSSTRLIRSFNVVSVLRTLFREGASPKAAIARNTSMSLATVNRIIAELCEQGLVSEDRIAESTGGRKPVVYKLNDDKLYVVGIEFVRDRIALGLCNLQGRIQARRSYRPYSLEPDNLIAEMVKEFELLLSANKINPEHILGSGLAISGIVQSERGLLQRSVNLGWRDVGVAEALERALGLPVVVENDANAAALAEFWFGCARDTANFLFLKTDTGVGAGVVCNGDLMAGPRGMAGEVGHVPVIRGGRACVCGQRGCLETYLYAQGLLRRYEEEVGIRLARAEDFFARIKTGDPAAVAMMEEAVEALGMIVATAGTMIDLDLVVIGGLWGELGELFCRPVERYAGQVFDRSGLAKAIEIRGSVLGEDSDLLGAVGIVIHRWFTPPILAQRTPGMAGARRS